MENHSSIFVIAPENESNVGHVTTSAVKTFQLEIVQAKNEFLKVYLFYMRTRRLFQDGKNVKCNE